MAESLPVFPLHLNLRSCDIWPLSDISEPQDLGLNVILVVYDDALQAGESSARLPKQILQQHHRTQRKDSKEEGPGIRRRGRSGDSGRPAASQASITTSCCFIALPWTMAQRRKTKRPKIVVSFRTTLHGDNKG